VTLSADEIEHSKYSFEATAEGDAETDFYAWDFNHKPEIGFNPNILMDKEGKQIRKFTPGEHLVAVEAVDKKGLDGQDKVKINVEEK
jgi:hypothetical protein